MIRILLLSQRIHECTLSSFSLFSRYEDNPWGFTVESVVLAKLPNPD